MKNDDDSGESNLEGIGRAMKFGLACVLLTYVGKLFFVQTRIGSFKDIFNEMLEGEPLPPAAQFAFSQPYLPIGLAGAFFLLGAAAVFATRAKPGLHLLGLLILCAWVMDMFYDHALLTPLTTVITKMQK